LGVFVAVVGVFVAVVTVVSTLPGRIVAHVELHSRNVGLLGGWVDAT
jgi:hypothetical protein